MANYEPKYSEKEYLGFSIYADGDGELHLHKKKIVTTRTVHQCMSPNGRKSGHEIPPGTRALFEMALIDKTHWGQCYTCLECVDRWFDEWGV